MSTARLLFLAQLWATSALLLEPAHDNTRVRVLVFGDSWGSKGPGWRMLSRMFAYHGVMAAVKSTAITGTRACQWSVNHHNLLHAADTAFPGSGPDFVWYTLGGNDLYDNDYQDCQIRSRNYEEASQCVVHKATKTNKCSFTLLEPLFKKYENVKVVQCAYDSECAEGNCLPMSKWAFCAYNISCANRLGVQWQTALLTQATDHFKDHGRYTGININGALQMAGGVPGAKAGQPNLEVGAPCEFLAGCVHPKPKSAGSRAIGEAFWELYFKNHVKQTQAPEEPEPTLSMQNHEVVSHQGDAALQETRCNYDWVPDLSLGGSMTAPPCL